MRQAAFAAGRDDLRADQDRAGALVSRDLSGHLEQGRHLGHGVAAPDGLRQLSDRLGWLHKIRKAMVHPERRPLADRVEADETLVGGGQSGKPGRGAPAKPWSPVRSRAAPGKGRKRRLGRLRLGPSPRLGRKPGGLPRCRQPPRPPRSLPMAGKAMGSGRPGYAHEGSISAAWGDAGCACRRSTSLRPCQAVAARHAPWRGRPEAPAGLPRRVCFPLQSPHRQEHQSPLRSPGRARRGHPTLSYRDIIGQTSSA